MRLKVWEPFREFKPFYRDVDRLINEFTRGHQLTEGPEKETWSPKVDIYETEGSYVLNAELPGLKKEEIKIDLNDNTLTLKGERKFEEKVEKGNYVRFESSYGSFARSFVLSDNVNAENITANYKDGVLEARRAVGHAFRPAHHGLGTLLRELPGERSEVRESRRAFGQLGDVVARAVPELTVGPSSEHACRPEFPHLDVPDILQFPHGLQRVAESPGVHGGAPRIAADLQRPGLRVLEGPTRIESRPGEHEHAKLVGEQPRKVGFESLEGVGQIIGIQAHEEGTEAVRTGQPVLVFERATKRGHAGEFGL